VFVGIDNSDEMLKQCEVNLKNENIERKVNYSNQDLNTNVNLENPSVVIFCLTLQFIRPKNRERILKKIYESLPENGALIIVEKVLAEHSVTNRHFIDYYYNFKKRNGYSETEIAKKREALENVLVPYKISENTEVLKDCGFSKVETFFKWYNFAGLIAIK
jgi:tRNA (cmo5U34)-methyltransferase